MMLSRFERVLPWSGAIAGLAWIGQEVLFKVEAEDRPGTANTTIIHNHLALNYGAVGCLVIMGIALVFFASAVRSQPAFG